MEAIVKPIGNKDNYVTDKNYYMDKFLKHYLDLIINERLSRESEDDALIICEGDEGTGKSSMAGHIGYYMAQKTGRAFSGKTFFLNTDEMMQFASKTYRQVICWDEPAVSGMSDEWWNKEQRKLKKMLTMIRQHQHLYIFNFARFHKFGEFFVVDRSIAMIKTYKRNRLEHGHFMYFNTKAKEQLYQDWTKKHIRNYQQNATFYGRFFTPLEFFLSPEDYKEYKIKKDQAILNLVNDEEKPNKYKDELMILRYKLSQIKKKDWLQFKNQEDLAHVLGVSPMSMDRWGRYTLKYPKLFKLPNENAVFTKENEPNTIKNGANIINQLKDEENGDDIQ